MGLFACGHQLAIPCAEPDWRFPTDRLDRGRELFQAQLQVTTDVRGIPVGPGAFDESTTRMGVARLGQAALLTTWPTGIFCRRQPPIIHELSGVIDARQVAAFGHHGHRDRALDAPYGLERLDHGLEAPGVHLVLECVFETLQARGLFGHGLAVCLQDHWLRRGGTDHLTEPAQVGRAPIGSPCRADSVPQPEGFEPPLGRLQIPAGLFTRPAQVADGFSVDGGHRPGVRSPERISRAHGRASRRAVLTRSPGFLGIKEGATTQQP